MNRRREGGQAGTPGVAQACTPWRTLGNDVHVSLGHVLQAGAAGGQGPGQSVGAAGSRRQAQQPKAPAQAQGTHRCVGVALNIGDYKFQGACGSQCFVCKPRGVSPGSAVCAARRATRPCMACGCTWPLLSQQRGLAGTPCACLAGRTAARRRWGGSAGPETCRRPA